MPVKGTLPVLVNVNAWAGQLPPIPANPVVHPRVAAGVQVTGVSVALTTAAFGQLWYRDSCE